MIAAWSVKDVRAAEKRALAGLPEGELMARAAKGLAMVVAARIEDVDEPQVVALVGSGGNGGDALFALAQLAGSTGNDEGDDAGVTASAVLVSNRGAHKAGLAAAREAGVQIVDLADTELESDEMIQALALVAGVPSRIRP